jgi:hypothetical protein
MRAKISALVVLLVVSIVFADGQTRQRRTPPAKPKPIPSPTATVTPTPTPTPEASLSIEAGVIFKSGDVKPVARTTFYLLDEDFKTILQREFRGTSYDSLSFEQQLIRVDLLHYENRATTWSKSTPWRHRLLTSLVRPDSVRFRPEVDFCLGSFRPSTRSGYGICQSKYPQVYRSR